MRRLSLSKAPPAGSTRSIRGRGALWSIASVCVVAVVALVATSASAVAAGCPNEAIRAQQGSQHLPECRAYEMVSPLDKNGADISNGPGNTRASASGGSVSFMSTGAFDTAGTGTMGYSTYLYNRADDGWHGHGINVYQDSNIFGGIPGGGGNVYPALSDDLSSGILFAREPFPDPVATTGIPNLFSWERATNTYRAVSLNESGSPVGFTFEIPHFAGATSDFGNVVFNTKLNLTPDATGGSWKAYHWDEGMLELVGILPGPGATPSTFSVIGGGAGASAQKLATDEGNAISTDGSMVFFTDVTDGSTDCDGDCEGQVYLRKNGEETILLNEEENPSEDVPVGQATFMQATPDGGAVFFTSRQHLVEADQDAEDEAGTDLYMYDTTKPPGESSLTLISDPAVLPDGSGGVIGLLGASESGERVYFAFEPAAATNPPEADLWAYDKGQLKEIGDLWAGPTEPSDQGSFPSSIHDSANWNPGGRGAVVTGDGRFLLFRSQRQQPDEFDNAGTAQIYVYDADAGSTVCASCDPRTDHATGSALTAPNVTGVAGYISPPREISSDGRTVFFHSLDDLVSRDTNGQMDPYAYDVESGRLSLLSSGLGSSWSYFAGASADGSTAFILTRDRLVGRDRDGLLDLYAVRVNGGFHEPAAPPAPCVGEACQGQGTPSPGGAVPASSTTAGTGNISPGPNCSRLATKVSKAKRRLRNARRHSRSSKLHRADRRLHRADRRPVNRNLHKMRQRAGKPRLRKARVREAKRKLRKARRQLKACKRGDRS